MKPAPDACKNAESSASNCASTPGCTWDTALTHMVTVDGKQEYKSGGCRAVPGTCSFSAADSGTELGQVMSSKACYGSGGQWLAPPQLYIQGDEKTPAPLGYGWTCVNNSPSPELMGGSDDTPIIDMTDCYENVCLTKGVVPALPSNPSPDGTDVTADMLQQLSSCWKPAFFNPCKGCLAIPEGYFRGDGKGGPSPAQRLRHFWRSAVGKVLSVFVVLGFLLLIVFIFRGDGRAYRR